MNQEPEAKMVGRSSRELQMTLEDPRAAVAIESSNPSWTRVNQIPSSSLHHGPRDAEEAVARELTLLVDGSGL